MIGGTEDVKKETWGSTLVHIGMAIGIGLGMFYIGKIVFHTDIMRPAPFTISYLLLLRRH